MQLITTPPVTRKRQYEYVNSGGADMSDPVKVVASVSALSVAIAEGRSSEEISLLAAVFSQLGDTLATIAAVMEIGEHKEDDD